MGGGVFLVRGTKMVSMRGGPLPVITTTETCFERWIARDGDLLARGTKMGPMWADPSHVGVIQFCFDLKARATVL